MLLKLLLLTGAAVHSALALPGRSESLENLCYTQTVTTETTGSACPPLTRCPPHPTCIIETTETVILPPDDPSCPTTPTFTVTVPGPCPTCRKGCVTLTTSTTTVYDTSATATATAKLARNTSSTSAQTPSTYLNATPSPNAAPATPCTITLLVGGGFTHGPTRTVHLTTSTSTVYEDCGGCENLVMRNVLGVGPAVIYTATVTDEAPTTTTEYLCAPSSSGSSRDLS